MTQPPLSAPSTGVALDRQDQTRTLATWEAYSEANPVPQGEPGGDLWEATQAVATSYRTKAFGESPCLGATLGGPEVSRAWRRGSNGLLASQGQQAVGLEAAEGSSASSATSPRSPSRTGRWGSRLSRGLSGPWSGLSLANG